MRIEKLHIKNFRGFKDLTITFSSSNLSLFIGINGAGKTSILDSIASLLSLFTLKLSKKDSRGIEFPLDEDDINVNASSMCNTITLKDTDESISWQYMQYLSYMDKGKEKNTFNELNEYVRNFHEKLSSASHINLPIIIYYQTNRILANSDRKKTSTNPKRYISNQIYAYQDALSKKGNDFHQFVNWFRLEEDWENENKLEKGLQFESESLKVVREVIQLFFSKLSSNEFSNLRVRRTKKEDKYGSFNAQHSSELIISSQNQDLKIEQLSDGYKTLLLLVSDIAHRLAIANPIGEPIQGRGIVLIDEIEQHLHPKWQRQVIPALLYTFPNVQFIITSHSPQILSSVDKEEVFILDDFDIVEETPATKGRDSNSILYELQEVEERPKEFKEKLKRLYYLIDNEDIEEAKKILLELTEKWGENDSEIVRINMHLNFATD